MAIVMLNNFSDDGDKKTYFPIFSENKLKIYNFSYEWWVEEYINSIKDKYSYRDIIICDQDTCSSVFSMPYTLKYNDGKRYDVLDYHVSDTSSNENRYGGNRTCEYIAEVNYYPKLYILLKNILKNKGIIDLKDIANYFKEYLGENNYIKDERKVGKKDITSVSFDSIEIGNPEIEAGFGVIRDEVINFPLSTILQFEKEVDVVDEKMVVDINISGEELEYLRNCYYIGRTNKAAIDYINNDLKYKNINNKVYKKVGEIMRLRNVKNKEEILNNSKFLVKDYFDYCGKWSSLFGNSNPIYIEIGMGKGKFIRENARKYPNINFIGIEKFDSVVAKCLPKIDDDLQNLLIIRMDALDIDKVFKNEISRIYLNFSDPWPKMRHHLRRLSSKVFLDKYENIFKDNKEIFMRTDNSDLFTYSLESFSENGYILRDISLDLHKDVDDFGDFITTEYEDRFSQKGMAIYSVKAVKSVQISK